MACGKFYLIEPSKWLFPNHGDVMGAIRRADSFWNISKSYKEAEYEIEEFIRQWAIGELIFAYGYSRDSVEIERRLEREEVDIVVKDAFGNDHILIEVKSRTSSSQLNKAKTQLMGYLRKSKTASYGWVTDGDQNIFLRKVGKTIEAANDIPMNTVSTRRRVIRDQDDLREETLGHIFDFPSEMLPDDQSWLECFVRRFPKERLTSLSLEDYAVGLGSRDSFCYRLEFCNNLGLIKGQAPFKWGVYWHKANGAWWYDSDFPSAKNALKCIMRKLSELVEAFDGKDFEYADSIAEHHYLGTKRWPLRTKPLYFYFPDQVLPIHSDRHLKRYLSFFGLDVSGGALTRNLRLLEYLRSQPGFETRSTQSMMFFLYEFVLVPGTDPFSGRRKQINGFTSS